MLPVVGCAQMPQGKYAAKPSVATANVFASDDSAPLRLTSTTRLNSALAMYAAFEFFAVIFSSYVGGYIYHHYAARSFYVNSAYLLAAVVMAILVLLASLGFHNFSAIRRQPRHAFLWRGVGSVAFAFSIFLTILFLTQLSGEYSRGSLIFQVVTVGITVVTARALFYWCLQSAIASNKIQARQVVLIGEASVRSKFASRLKASGIEATGSFQLPKARDLHGTSPTTRKIIADIRPLKADDIIVLTDNETLPAVFEFASLLSELPAGIHIVPVDALGVLASSQIAEFGPLQTIQVYRPPLSTFDRFIKRAFDLTLAAIGLDCALPAILDCFD